MLWLHAKKFWSKFSLLLSLTRSRGSLQKGIQWDEETIAGIKPLESLSDFNKPETFQECMTLSQSLTTFNLLSLEHDKDRGTRQKIDEPPTPYSYYPYEGKFVHLSHSPFQP